MKHTRLLTTVALLLCLFSFVFPVAAQDATFTETYTFDSGVSVRYPPTWSVDEENTELLLFLTTESTLISFFEPALVESAPGDSLESILELVFAVIYEEIAFDINQAYPVQVGNREGLRFDYTDGDARGFAIAFRFSDETVGVADVWSTQKLGNDAQVALEIIETFDVRTKTPPNTTTTTTTTDDLPLTYSFDSGVSFRYPASWTIDDNVEDIEYLAFTYSDETIISFWQPDEIGDTVTNTLGRILEFVFTSVRTTLDYNASEAYPQPLDGRDALRYDFVTENGDAGTMIAVRFSDGTAGVVHATALGTGTTFAEIDTVLVIAATFDSAPVEPTLELTGTYTFPSGISFQYPDGWVTDDEFTEYLVFVDDGETLISLIEPDDLATLITVDLSGDMFTVLEAIFSNVRDELLFDANVVDTSSIGGRNAARIDFNDSSGEPGMMIAIRLNDGKAGVVHASTLSGGTFAPDAVLAVAASFDYANATTDTGDTGTTSLADILTNTSNSSDGSTSLADAFGNTDNTGTNSDETLDSNTDTSVANLTEITGNGVAVSLPVSFVGGDPVEDKAAILDAAAQIDSFVVDNFSNLITVPELRLLAIDLATSTPDFVTNINIMYLTDTGNDFTFDEYVQAVERNNAGNVLIEDVENVTVGGFEAVRITQVDPAPIPLFKQYLYAIRTPDSVYEIAYTAPADIFDDLAEQYEASANSFRALP